MSGPASGGTSAGADAALHALGEIAGDGWLVGGAVRDSRLGRPRSDFDAVLRGEPGGAARRLADALDAHRFVLSEGFGAWRVIARDRAWQVDLMALAGETIEEDLARRDLTVNAIAEPLGGGPVVDPFSGLADLSARRLRMVSPRAFADDPLRVLRLARHGCELGFAVEDATREAARVAAGGLRGVAAERVFAELRRIVCADDVVAGLGLLDALDATPVVLPELSGLRGVEQSPYHHLDVHDHTLAVLEQTLALERDPGRHFPADAEALSAVLAEPLADELTRAQALRLGALLHDAAKPRTRAVSPEGRITFIGHDALGAEQARATLQRLRASERLGAHVAALTRNHLRLGFLVHQAPLHRRAVYGYLRACEPVEVDVTLLSVADRLATRGRRAEEAIARHMELARALMPEALRWRTARPRPPLRGDQLAAATGLRPGPRLGELLRELEQASFAGEISSPEQAIARARRLLGAEPPAPPPDR